MHCLSRMCAPTKYDSSFLRVRFITALASDVQSGGSPILSHSQELRHVRALKQSSMRTAIELENWGV